ncbi:MAG TPA: glycosyl hydrolase family 65 protein, partial [Lacipirellula sp.]
FAILDPDSYSHYVDKYNAADEEAVVNLVPNRDVWAWIVAQAPLLDCPSGLLEEIYYFRWWTYRKHFRETPDGVVMTEFILPVSHAGPHNTISCALGHQLTEGRWLRDGRWLDDYATFWFRSGPDGGRAAHFHKFSSWAAAALYERYLVTGDASLLVDLLPNLAADYRAWEAERQRDDGLFWQYDVADGMEESISGGRREKNVRPTINSYMAANARAIANIARLAGNASLEAEFRAKHEELKTKLLQTLWDLDAAFFKVRKQSGDLSDAREAIGFIPWMFDLAEPAHAEAWMQITDPQGFWAPRGLTTAERRHPEFRTHGTGTCEWDGAVWPFATSQTLTGLANVLRDKPQPYVTRRHYFEQLLSYARAHELDGKAYIGEYHDEITGEWLIKGEKAERSRYYNHSTFNDLVISGLVGIVPRADEVLVIDPLLPEDAWDWFCLDGVPYHGRTVTVAWDRDGSRYQRGTGLAVWIDGQEAARSSDLAQLEVRLPKNSRGESN